MSSRDYYVVTFRTGPAMDVWAWEIRRRNKPMGVKLGGTGFRSDEAAIYAGKRELTLFLDDLEKEARRKDVRHD